MFERLRRIIVCCACKVSYKKWMVKRLLNHYRVNVYVMNYLYAFIISVHEIPVGAYCVHNIPTRNNTKTLTFLFWLFIRLKFVNICEDFECIIVNFYYDCTRRSLGAAIGCFCYIQGDLFKFLSTPIQFFSIIY